MVCEFFGGSHIWLDPISRRGVRDVSQIALFFADFRAHCRTIGAKMSYAAYDGILVLAKN